MLTLKSSAFEENGVIPNKHTCKGENVSPELIIEGVPEDTVSLALIMDDPDALGPAGRVWDHWIVFDMPPSTAHIAEGQEPPGKHGKGTSGTSRYSGPCPPDAEHAYYFKLYALGTMLNLPEGVSKTDVEKAMERHILEQATLIGRFAP